MLTFIVIGKNEGWKLSICLKSIYSVICDLRLSSYEVIYVDSGSTDNSVANARQFEETKVFLLTGACNAAIARNVGATEASGDVLFFIDGDMEIEAVFLSLVYDEINGLKNDFLSGDWLNLYYDKGVIKNKRLQYNINSDIQEKVTGGLFLIKKDKWDLVNGMNPIFYRSQDIDFGLRLAQKGVFLLRKKELAAKHHTVSYKNKNRMWKDFASLNHLYGSSLLYRRHLLNKHMYYRFFRNDYSLICLTLFSVLSFFYVFKALFVLYLLIIVFRAKFRLNRILFFALRDVTSLAGFFLFYPRLNRAITYRYVTESNNLS